MVLGKKGFTLLEIWLVIIILAVAVAMTIPSFTRSFGQLELRDTANHLAYLMRYAQSRAIYTQRPLRLLFEEAMTYYRLEEAEKTSEEVAEDDEEDVDYRPVSGRFGRIHRIPRDISVHTESPFIVFTPDGRIEKTQINLCQAAQCLTVSTQNQSGQVIVAEGQAQ